jgi:hypothetical protein
VAQSLADADIPLSNSAARADLIRDAVRHIATLEAEVRALNADIREYKTKTIKGDLGFKLADWNAVYRVSQLEVEDRDQLLDCVREGFAALGIGGVVDWVDAAEGLGEDGNGHANGAASDGSAAPRRGRGRPRKTRKEAGAEF